MKSWANGFDTFPKKMIAGYFVALMVMLLAGSLVIVVGLSQITSAEYSISGHGIPVTGSSAFNSGALVNATLITKQNSKLIYSSQVPESVAAELNAVQLESSQVSAFPMTISLVEADGSYPIVVEGFPITVIETLFPDASIMQANESSDNWIILGSLAADVLAAQVGSVVSISSPISNSAVNLTVIRIASFGNEKDYEAIVPLTVGQEIAGDSPGLVTAIAVPSTFIGQIGSLVRSVYDLNINYSGIGGTMYFLDSTGFYHFASSISSANSSTIIKASVPLGSYNILLVHNGLRMVLGQYETQTNDSIIDLKSVPEGSPSFLFVKNDTRLEYPPKLLTSSNSTIFPSKFNRTANSWVFRIDAGQYNLILSGANGFTNSTEGLIILDNSTYDPSYAPSGSALNIMVSSSDQNISEYWLTVTDQETGQIAYSSLVSGQAQLIAVAPNQTYDVSILTEGTNVLLQGETSVTTTSASLNFDLPNVPQVLRNIPNIDYSVLGPGFPSGSESFTYLVRSTIVATAALIGMVLVLLSATIFALGGQAATSVQAQVRSLKIMFPGAISSMIRIYLPMLAISILAAIAAVLISLTLFAKFNIGPSVEFLGYGLDHFPLLYVAAPLGFLAFLSWIRLFISLVRIKPVTL